jgi:hypothetical protein
MSIFYVQLAFNLISLYWIYRYFFLEKRTQKLEREMAALRSQLEQPSGESYLDREPHVALSTMTITEKLIEKKPVILTTYDAAKRMIDEGKELSEVAAQTGLSVSELRLMEKVGAKNL